MTATNFIRRIVAMRKRLCRDGYSRRDEATVLSITDKVVRWIEFWSPTEEQVRNYIRNNRGMIEQIMPGDGSRSHEKLMHELEQLCA